MTLLERIAVLRELKGDISINRLEKEAGLTRGSMCKWDTHEPARDKLEKVANYFGVTVDYLLGKSTQDACSVAFRRNLEDALNALDTDAFAGVGEAVSDYHQLSYIVNGDFPLSLATACEAAEVLGESIDCLVYGHENGKKSPSSTSEDGLDAELVQRLTALTPEELAKVDAFVQGLLASR